MKDGPPGEAKASSKPFLKKAAAAPDSQANDESEAPPPVVTADLASGKISQTEKAPTSRRTPNAGARAGARGNGEGGESGARPQILAPSSPRDLLLSYQRKWSDDGARFKIGLMARQVGKDFSSGEEGIRDCYKCELEGNKTNWLIAAPSERQSLESLEKWKEWTEAYKLAIADLQIERENPRNSESLIKAATITFPHGSRVIAVPGRPDTVRGFSANILATEFAFFEDPDKTWRALLPSITNPLRGGPKKCRLISTPNGAGNKFHELWRKNYKQPGAEWSCHKVTITDAVAQGLPVDVEQLRRALDDPEGWAQEYDPLDFLDNASVLLSYELIIPCENPNASQSVGPEYWQAKGDAPVFLGIDFGRKRDLTVCWALELMGGAFRMTKEVLELKKVSTPEQLNILRPRIQKAKRVCFDYTGPGIGLGDLFVKEFSEYKPQAHQFGKVELCNFTNALKLEIYPKLRMAFESKTLGIPTNRVIREDLHSVNRIALQGGGLTYRAPHTEDGHADRCTALALAVRAATQASANYSCVLIG